jgi:hypothetical protein
MGIPPTGRPVSISGVDVGRFAGGKGVEHGASMDQLGFFQQLGVVGSGPAPGGGTRLRVARIAYSRGAPSIRPCV